MQEGSVGKVLHRHENLVGKIMFIIGIAQMILGIILGIIFSLVPGYEYYDIDMDTYSIGTTMDVKILIGFLISGFIGGMIFIGFSEVIKLLENINSKMKPLEGPTKQKSIQGAKESDLLNEIKSEDFSVSWTLVDADRQKIVDLYKNQHINRISPSQIEGYCIVKLKGNEEEIIKVVDVGGFGAKEIQDKAAIKTILSVDKGVQ